MKRMLMLTIVMLAIATTGTALATIDWAGQVYPNAGASVVPTGPIDVYAQVYKGGTTDAPGQGADISAVLTYTTDIAAGVAVPMAYLGDNGPSNDEYTAQVPQAALVGAAWVEIDITFTDASDGSTYTGLQDQAGNTLPVQFVVSDVLPNDVEVGFRLCLSGEETLGDVCVIGSDPAIGNWGTGVTMTDDGNGLYGVTVVFPAGSNPTFEYKYKKDGCATWESAPNRVVTLPTDGTTYYPIPDADSWNNLPITCGLGSTLEEDKVVCFQVCLSGVDNTGGVCVIGNVAELTGWTTGVPMVQIAPDLYQACITFSAGMPIPQNLEYKFKKDDCQTWEGGGNKLFTVDNTTAVETTLTHTWEDGPGVCDPVAIEGQSWGSLKTLYR